MFSLQRCLILAKPLIRIRYSWSFATGPVLPATRNKVSRHQTSVRAVSGNWSFLCDESLHAAAATCQSHLPDLFWPERNFSVLPARRRNKRWMQRGQCGVTLRNRHSACRTSVNIGQRCFSDTSVSKSCESAWRLKIWIAATESSKAFSLQTDREHPQRGSVTRIRVRCWTQSVRTTWRTRSHGTVCVDPRTGENHQLVPDYWDIWTLSDCEDGATQQSQLHAPQHNECASDPGRATAFLWLWMELVHVEQFNVSSWTWALSPPPLLPVRLHSEPRSLTRSAMIQRESPGDSFRSDRAGDEWHSAQLLFSLQQEYSTTLTSAKKTYDYLSENDKYHHSHAGSSFQHALVLNYVLV